MSDYEPLLVRFPESGDSIDDCDGPGWITVYRRARRATRKFLSSKAKHHLTLSLIVLDVAGILSGITIALVTCELHRQNEKWVALTMRGLSIFSLVLSCMFLQELILCLWVEGLQYLTKWLHILDAFVIVVSFAVDLIEHGIAEEIASLVIILRLWRFVKIVDEFSVEASEQMECMHRRIEDLETENAHLQRQLGRRASRDEESTMS